MLIFFPPRLIQTCPCEGDANAQIDEALHKYTDQGIAILLEETSVKDAHKIMNFGQQFKDLMAPAEPEKW